MSQRVRAYGSRARAPDDRRRSFIIGRASRDP